MSVWTLDGWTGYDGEHPPSASGAVFYVDRTTGWHTPPRTTPRIWPKIGRSGGFIGPSWRQPRVVELIGQIVAGGSGDELRTGMEFLASRCAAEQEGYELVETMPGGLVRRTGVRLNDEILITPSDQRLASFEVTVIAPDHRRYGSPRSLAWAPTVSSGGLGYPLAYPLAYGTAGGSGSRNLRNGGTVPSPPSFAVAGPSGPEGFEIVSEQGGHLRFIDELLAGQILTIDMAGPSVLLDGVANRRGELTIAKWFDLLPGDNVVQFLPLGSTGQPSVTATWSDAVL